MDAKICDECKELIPKGEVKNYLAQDMDENMVAEFSIKRLLRPIVKPGDFHEACLKERLALFAEEMT